MKNYDIQIGKKSKSILRSKYGLLLVLMTIGLCACDDFVEVDLPNSQLTAEAVFQDKFTATAALVDIYSKMRTAGVLSGSLAGTSSLIGNYADELDFYGNPQSAILPFYQNSVIATNRDIKTLWDNSYKQIYTANAVIEGVEQSTSLPQNTRDLLKGEALFIRSIIHFYLVNLYNDIPYIKTTDYLQNRQVSRTPANEVYQQIITDLETAIIVLPEEYATADRVRPNKFAAKALLARVYLYAGLWAEAANEASAVLNQVALYQLDTSLESSFLKNSNSTIWQFMSSAAGINTSEASTFIFNSGPPPNSALRAELLNAFETNDVRKTAWIRTVSNGTGTWHHAFKYKANTNTGTSVEFSKVLRVAELYLIRAEARARQGELITAKEDLNAIRLRSGLTETTANDQAELVNAILNERRVELFTEFGHRFFDLKRMNRLDEFLAPIKPGWSPTMAHLPIPEAEILLNPNLAPQNPGY